MKQNKLLEALAVTAELTGTELSEAAAKVMHNDLTAYPLGQVLSSLHRCRRELKGRLTIADVISRLDDGRPGAEEAWAMIPHDEQASVAWTSEMMIAFGVALPHIESGDNIAARMAFKEKYEKEVSKSRINAEPVRWTASLGWNKEGREAAQQKALENNLLALGEDKHSLLRSDAKAFGT